MRILDRYILKSILSIFISCIFVFLFLYVVIDILSHLEEILKQKADLVFLTQYYLWYLPIMFVHVAPIACLLSTLYTFGKLNHNNEIIAMRSSGLSILQVTKTVLILGVLVTLFVFWLGDRFVPQSLSITQKMRTHLEEGVKKQKGKKPEAISNLSMYGLKNRLYFINKFNIATNTMEGITILEHDEHQNLTKKIVANRGIYQDNLWRFYQSITYNFDSNGQIIEEPQYLEEEIMEISETPNDFITQRQHSDFMTVSELDEYIWKLSRSGATTVIRNLKVELYQRFTTPFTSFIIILLGVPFSLKMRKRATGLSSVGISFGMGFLYYIVNAVSIALGRAGIFMPVLAVSLSHIIALTFSLYLIRSLP